MKFHESYLCAAVSTSCLTESDISILDSGSNMIMRRDTGWFMKLYEDDEGAFQRQIEPFSAHLQALLKEAYDQGYRVVEFDADAPDPVWQYQFRRSATNESRAESASVAINAFARQNGLEDEDVETIVTDLIANLMHYCDCNDQMEKPVEYCISKATQHYYAEIDDGE